jgi:hypothetical protein
VCVCVRDGEHVLKQHRVILEDFAKMIMSQKPQNISDSHTVAYHRNRVLFVPKI